MRDKHAADFGFDNVLSSWFTKRFGLPTGVQQQAWAQIAGDGHILISSPTGSGKTLAALLPCLDGVVQEKRSSAKDYASGVRVLVVTPLKALNNDIHHHLLGFMQEIAAEAELQTLGRPLAEVSDTSPTSAKGADDAPWPGISVGVRTGDTSQSTRASMLKHPPDVLVTTPESLYLLLTSPRARQMLRTVRQVVVDEIHELAADKRGMHLSLTLERLDAWCGRPAQRIGVSATQKPIERVARYLGGWTNGQPRAVAIVESAADKRYDLLLTVPEPVRPGYGADREAIWTPLVQRILQVMEGCRAALVFVNSRRLCERLTLRLNDHAGYELARSHHGSVAREKRLEVERLLKAGELRCLVATSSLELGIDVGHVDLVIQIDSPQSAAAGIQRVGRAGHSVGGVSRGVLLARSRSSLPELAVLGRRIAARDIEAIRVPRGSLDVLAQQIVAMMAGGDEWELPELLRLLGQSDSFRAMSRDKVTAMLDVLSGLYPFVRPLIAWDRDADRLRALPVTSVAALTGAGTIPQSTAYPVHHNESGLRLGELDEEFIQESSVGDVFQLGTSSWRIVRIRPERVYVSESENRYSEIPFWRGEAGSRSFELGAETGRLWRELSERLRGSLDEGGFTGLSEAQDGERAAAANGKPEASSDPQEKHSEHSLQDSAEDAPDAALALNGPATEAEAATEAGAADASRKAKDAAALSWLMSECFMDAAAGSQLIAFVRSQMAAHAVPTDRTVVLESFADEHGQTHIVLHSLFGRRLNRAWLMALESKLRVHGWTPLYSNAKDNGIELVLRLEGSGQIAAVTQQLIALRADEAEQLLSEAVAGSPMFAAAFSRLAETSLLLSRSFERMPAWKKRMRSEELLKASLPYKERFPLLQEAVRECLEEQLDAARLQTLLTEAAAGRLTFAVRHSLYPSPLAAAFQADYVQTKLYESDALPRDLQLELVGFSRQLAAEVFGPEAVRQAIDPQVLAAEAARLERGTPAHAAAPDGPDSLLRLLKEQGDSSRAELERAIPAEQLDGWLDALLTDRRAQAVACGGESRYISSDERELYADVHVSAFAQSFILQRYADRVLSFTAATLAERYGLDATAAANWIQSTAASGAVQPAPFAAGEDEGLWTSGKIASRLIRMSLEAYRRAEDAVSPFDYWRSMPLREQLGRSAAPGTEGLREALRSLEGLFLPVSLWESVLLPSRQTGYRKQELDLLCASGELVWVGRQEPEEKEGRIAFFLQDSPDGKLLLAPCLERAALRPPSRPALLELIRSKGASFLSRLSLEAGQPPSALLGELLDLVWDGRIANDQFAPLRLHAAAAKRSAPKGDKFQSGLGRWYALETTADRAYDREAAALLWTRHLLDRFGIMTKDVAEAYSPYTWDVHLPALRQLELWGLVVRGLFIRDLPALQFAAKTFLDRLRRTLPANTVPAGEPTLICALDPANPFGLIVPWPSVKGATFARKNGNFLLVQGGSWLYWIENNGRRIYSMSHAALATTAGPTLTIRPDRSSDLDPSLSADAGSAFSPQARESTAADTLAEDDAAQALERLKSMFRLFLRSQSLRKIVVDSWNGVRIADAPERELLQRLGAERDRNSYVLWPSQLQ
ncbi:DEAD/DEAH box helicase [Paenibacillus athensensis]|uniref:DEAD/DEAH box helicase n=1 Tax=Paenibacillus athensensis TaxID=1967502 RepID=A0A4Y8PSA9_9BACL|nr:DEAD/DEAH box helicase [Paenibacillus athensensis]MCD1258113.1 DEAD/DEAH box helicase [Paenibacillus athensensis]